MFLWMTLNENEDAPQTILVVGFSILMFHVENVFRVQEIIFVFDPEVKRKKGGVNKQIKGGVVLFFLKVITKNNRREGISIFLSIFVFWVCTFCCLIWK